MNTVYKVGVPPKAPSIEFNSLYIWQHIDFQRMSNSGLESLMLVITLSEDSRYSLNLWLARIGIDEYCLPSCGTTESTFDKGQ